MRKRIQRKRTLGWRMPPNTVYVGRPTKYGNPYRDCQYGRAEALHQYEYWLNIKLAADPHFLDDLKGKDLACFCRLDEPCHADILLRKIKELDQQAALQQMETE